MHSNQHDIKKTCYAKGQPTNQYKFIYLFLLCFFLKTAANKPIQVGFGWVFFKLQPTNHFFKLVISFILNYQSTVFIFVLKYHYASLMINGMEKS